MNTGSGVAANDFIVGDTREGLIRSIIQKYQPGLAYTTDAPCEPGEYYGEWDMDAGLVFTSECVSLTDEEMAYVILHEIAHAFTGGGHSDNFYGVLTALVIAENVTWKTAFRIEQVTPRIWEPYRRLTARAKRGTLRSEVDTSASIM